MQTFHATIQEQKRISINKEVYEIEGLKKGDIVKVTVNILRINSEALWQDSKYPYPKG